MYVQDNDERLFFRSATNNPDVTRINTATTGNGLKWWNQTLPYIKNNQVFACPSDGGPTLSPDSNRHDRCERETIPFPARMSPPRLPRT